VVDGARRKRDGAQFLNAFNRGIPIGSNSLVRRVLPGECVLLREWAGSHPPVFFDFGAEQVLLWLLKGNPDESAYVAKFSRSYFIEVHRGGATQNAHDFDEFVKDLSKLIADYESHLRAQELRRAPRETLQGFRQYLVRRDRLKRRF